jgi:hypothetical protein
MNKKIDGFDIDGLEAFDEKQKREREEFLTKQMPPFSNNNQIKIWFDNQELREKLFYAQQEIDYQQKNSREYSRSYVSKTYEAEEYKRQLDRRKAEILYFQAIIDKQKQEIKDLSNQININAKPIKKAAKKIKKVKKK